MFFGERYMTIALDCDHQSLGPISIASLRFRLKQTAEVVLEHR